jgi:TolA-binding protein
MRRMFEFLVLVAMVYGFSGCAAYDLGKKVSRLERSISDLRALQAEQSESLQSLDSQLKLVAGRLEEFEFSSNRRLGSDLTALKDDLSALRKRMPPPPGVPTAELEADESWAKSLNDETQRLFIDALGMMREGKFADAVPLLENASEQTQGSDRAGPVLFWLGVAHDGLLDNRGALRAYAGSISEYPKSHRAPSSLLRQAEVFVRLGDKKTAQLSLRKLIDDYPKSPEVIEAKERLRALK